MAEENDLEKNEAATPYKLGKAREKGNIPRSRELTSILLLGAGLGIFWMTGESMVRQLTAMLIEALNFDRAAISNDRQMMMGTLRLLLHVFWVLLPVMIGLALVAMVVPALVGGLLFSPTSLKFNFSRLNPVTGLKNLFSTRLLVDLFKSLLKIILAGTVTGLFLWVYRLRLLHLTSESLLKALGDAINLVILCGLLAVMSLIPMAGLDVLYQIMNHKKKLRMSKKEIADEGKENEGDPLIKSRIRQVQRELSRMRMMADVPNADVIITNPTHYAVALQYIDKKMSAPKVLAKGAGEIALRIRELGVQHRVPLLEAPSLARALYRHSEVGKHIPVTLYAAVAEVLAWVYQLKRWRHEGGLTPKKPENLPVPEALDFVEENDTHG